MPLLKIQHLNSDKDRIESAEEEGEGERREEKRQMGFEKQDLDVVLVPGGLLVMFGYHLFLLYRYLHLPDTTVMGFENHDKRAWAKAIVEVIWQAPVRLINLALIINFAVATSYRPERLAVI